MDEKVERRLGECQEKPLPIVAVSVSSITYGTEGGKNNDRHLLITVALVDDLDDPVSGASVSIDLFRGGSFTASGTGTTGGGGTVTLVLKNAPSGDYTTTVTDVTADGLTWDGMTPPNDFTKTRGSKGKSASARLEVAK